MSFILGESDRTLILGSSGMVGKAFIRALPHVLGDHNEHGEREVDLLSYENTKKYLNQELFKYFHTIIMCAGDVSGIHGNMNNSDTLYNNTVMGLNVAKALHEVKGFHQLIYLSSSCVYSPDLKPPYTTDMLFKGKVEETNEGYAIAKLAVMQYLLTQNRVNNFTNWIYIPPNLYGDDQNYDQFKSHVLAALIRKVMDAKLYNLKTIYMNGDPTIKREFMHVDNFVFNLIKHVQEYPNPGVYNIGVNKEISIRELLIMIIDIIDYDGKIKWQNDGCVGIKSKLMKADVIGQENLVIDIKKIIENMWRRICIQ
jgi:GDP-L-fucose synthase